MKFLKIVCAAVTIFLFVFYICIFAYHSLVHPIAISAEAKASFETFRLYSGIFCAVLWAIYRMYANTANETDPVLRSVMGIIGCMYVGFLMWPLFIYMVAEQIYAAIKEKGNENNLS